MTNAIEIKILINSMIINYAFQILHLMQKEKFLHFWDQMVWKVTLINITTVSQIKLGKEVFGMDNIKTIKSKAFNRSIPQEIATDSFENIINTMKFAEACSICPLQRNT